MSETSSVERPVRQDGWYWVRKDGWCRTMTAPKPPIWPFPPNGKPTPPTPQQRKKDEREELERLGDALM